MNVSGARVLLTGATGGLGQAIARGFGRSGADLVLSGRRADVLESLADELGARTIVCDLSNSTDVAQLAHDAGEIDVLVANAGIPAVGELTVLPPAEIDRMLAVNLRAPIALTRAFAPAMIARGSGHLVFVSSLAGKVTSPDSSIYSATKFGLRGFALGLRQDLRVHGVGVSVVFPGFIREAGMFAAAQVALPPGVGTRSPQDVAEAVRSAVEHDKAEVNVAPVSIRLGARLAGLAPELAAKVMRMAGSDRIAREFAKATRGDPCRSSS